MTISKIAVYITLFLCFACESGKEVTPEIILPEPSSLEKILTRANCSVCWGSCQGVIGENEVLISTGTRNFKGRAGHPSSKVYLGSAATVTASAIAGEIALAEDVM